MAKRGRTLKNMSLKKDFLDSIKLLYVLGKYFGLSCYSLSKDGKKFKVSFKTSDLLQLFVFDGIYLILIYYNVKYKLNITNDAKKGSIFNTGQQILIVISLVFVLGRTIKIVLTRHNFCEIANTLNEIDYEMKQSLKIQINDNKLYRHTIIFVSLCFLALAWNYIIFGYYFFLTSKGVISKELIQFILSYVIVNSAFLLIILQFQLFIYSIFMRFSTLNKFLESRISPDERQMLSPSKSSELQKNVFLIAKLYDQLNSVVPKICSHFATMLVPATAGIFCVSVFNFNNFFKVLREKTTYEFSILIISYDGLSLFFNIMTFICIAICSMNTSSAKRMGVLAHKIIARTHDPHFILKLKILSQQILHRSPDFSFGIFSLNWSFAFTYIASCASYLIILIQFENYITENGSKVDAFILESSSCAHPKML